MPLVLQILGSLLGVAGLLMIGFGLPIRYTALDNTLIAAGITALVGGLVLIGMGTALRELRKLARILAQGVVPAPAEAQPARSPRVRGPLPMPAMPRPEPRTEPRPEPRLDPAINEAPAEFEPEPEVAPEPEPAPAEPRQRPSIFALVRGSRTEHYEIDEAEGVPLSPAIAPRAPSVPEPADAGEEPMFEPRFTTPRAEPRREPRVEPRAEPARAESRPPSPAALASRTAARIDMPRPVPELPRANERSGRNLFDSVWPNEQKRDPSLDRAPEPPASERRERPLFVPEPEPARDAGDLAHAAVREAFESLSLGGAEEKPARKEPRLDTRAEPKPVTILKSGVIDGMAYTLYTDGSIEAQLPTGLMRFASIDDLRTYLERNAGN